MNMNFVYSKDIEEILSHRHDLGGDLWTTPDKRLLKGSPFSMLECVMYLLELGLAVDDVLFQKASELIFSCLRADGQFKLSLGSVYPCHTAVATKVLCHLKYAHDDRLKQTFNFLLDTQCDDGGWRCRKFSYGHGPETEYSNPFPTLNILDAFRFTPLLNQEPSLDLAVDFLLKHWDIRQPIGPCHYGIGTLFMQVEYPFRTYNLFEYVYVLSFYSRARKDHRFQDAFNTLKSKTVNDQIVVERVVNKLASLSFCIKNKPSELATKCYHKILDNISI